MKISLFFTFTLIAVLSWKFGQNIETNYCKEQLLYSKMINAYLWFCPQPDVVGNLTNLQELWIDANRVTEIPEVSFTVLLMIIQVLKAKKILWDLKLDILEE